MPRYTIQTSKILAILIFTLAQIVCIDEGTANLDNDSETAIQLVLRNAFKSSTCILISHRLTLQQTDRIIVMDHGEIVEQGDSILLANDSNSLFHGMLASQGIGHFDRDAINHELL